NSGLKSRSRELPSTWSSGAGHQVRDGAPFCVTTRRTLPPWICSLCRPLASTCSMPSYIVRLDRRSDVIGDFQAPYGVVLVEGDDIAALSSRPLRKRRGCRRGWPAVTPIRGTRRTSVRVDRSPCVAARSADDRAQHSLLQAGSST